MARALVHVTKYWRIPPFLFLSTVLFLIFSGLVSLVIFRTSTVFAEVSGGGSGVNNRVEENKGTEGPNVCQVVSGGGVCDVYDGGNGGSGGGTGGSGGGSF